jgi:hypothetical protein
MGPVPGQARTLHIATLHMATLHAAARHAAAQWMCDRSSLTYWAFTVP